MAWLKRNVQIREDPAKLLPNARTVICVALNYRRQDGYRGPRLDHDPLPPPAEPSGRVSQYARGRDYHAVMRERLETLASRMREALPEPFEYRICVDTAPLLERELAAAAGLGWIGKNTCLLDGHFGSYLFLGELLTTLDLPADAPVAERCATCTRCIDACPTQAIRSPRLLDATRCIAYHTIENRGSIPEEFRPAMEDWVFGCDICQQVCPYNAKAPETTHPDLAEDRLPSFVPLTRLLQIRSSEYRRLVRGTAGRRARREMWQRNAAVVAANIHSRNAPPATRDSERQNPRS